MRNPTWLEQEDDWHVLLTFLPVGWQIKAKELGALWRCRKFENVDLLLWIFLIYLVDGCSLRETAVKAKLSNIASISDVALLKRLNASGEWFRWMAVEVMERWISKEPVSLFGKNLSIRIIDGTTVQEPGSTGSTWRIHYSIGLLFLQCDEVLVTSPEEGESFKRFKVHPRDLFLGDRGFAHRAGIHHVVKGGGEVLVRMNLTNLPLVNEKEVSVALLPHLRTLTKTKLKDWKV